MKKFIVRAYERNNKKIDEFVVEADSETTAQFLASQMIAQRYQGLDWWTHSVNEVSGDDKNLSQRIEFIDDKRCLL